MAFLNWPSPISYRNNPQGAVTMDLTFRALEQCPFPINNKPRRAGTMKQTETVVEHTDSLGQQIRVNSLVAWTWSGGTGVRVGRIVRLTAKRVRIAYTTEWWDRDHNQSRRYSSTHVTAPDNVLVLDQGVEAQLTLQALKGLIPG